MRFSLPVQSLLGMGQFRFIHFIFRHRVYELRVPKPFTLEWLTDGHAQLHNYGLGWIRLDLALILLMVFEKSVHEKHFS
jgi:hypothetical protein